MRAIVPLSSRPVGIIARLFRTLTRVEPRHAPLFSRLHAAAQYGFVTGITDTGVYM